MNMSQVFTNNHHSSRLSAFPLNDVGTGGCITPDALRIIIALKQTNANFDIEFDDKKINIRSPKQNLDLIRQNMQLSIVDLSFIFNVTRPTIYSWLENVEPKTEISQHIQTISNLAEQLQSYKIANIGKLLHRPILDGQSLLEKFRAFEKIDENWELFKKHLTTELKHRSIQKGSGKNRIDLNKTIHQYSTLISKE